MPQSQPGVPIDHALRHKVWQVEEKLTDVNIALNFYRDAVLRSADVQVVCSNDTDMMPAMAMVRVDFPDQRIGLVAPLPDPSITDSDRYVATSLQEHAAWTRRYLRHDELLAAQLPQQVPTRKKPIIKPTYW
ncbi:MAG: NYN domain-containing protein [Aeromicrobium sp.]|nr:NYN domain-containing protein [Burkholderiales bacterium]